MRLSDYLRPELVVTDFTATSTSDVIEQVARHLAVHADVPATRDVAAALTAREQQHSTVLAEGIALPHATIEGLERTTLMVAVAPEPIQFGPPDTDPVAIFIVLLSPPGLAGEHIKLLARICRLVRDADFVAALRRATSAEEASEVIRRTDRKHA